MLIRKVGRSRAVEVVAGGGARRRGSRRQRTLIRRMRRTARSATVDFADEGDLPAAAELDEAVAAELNREA